MMFAKLPYDGLTDCEILLKFAHPFFGRPCLKS
jgi:hypothetical protein